MSNDSRKAGIVLTLNPFSGNVNQDDESFCALFYFVNKTADGWRAVGEEEQQLRVGDKYVFFVQDLSTEAEITEGGLRFLVDFQNAAGQGRSPLNPDNTASLRNGMLLGDGKSKTKTASLIGFEPGGDGEFGTARFGSFTLVNPGSYDMSLTVTYGTVEGHHGVVAKKYKVDPHMDVDG